MAGRKVEGIATYLVTPAYYFWKCVKIRYFGMEDIKREDIPIYLMNPSCSPEYETC